MRDRQQWRASVRKTKRHLLSIAARTSRDNLRLRFRLRDAQAQLRFQQYELDMLRFAVAALTSEGSGDE